MWLALLNIYVMMYSNVVCTYLNVDQGNKVDYAREHNMNWQFLTNNCNTFICVFIQCKFHIILYAYLRK